MLVDLVGGFNPSKTYWSDWIIIIIIIPTIGEYKKMFQTTNQNVLGNPSMKNRPELPQRVHYCACIVTAGRQLSVSYQSHVYYNYNAYK